MALATWGTGDPVVDIRPMTDFEARLADNGVALAALTGLTRAEVENRRRAGHRPYVGYWGATAVTYGWVACVTRRRWPESLLALHGSGGLYLQGGSRAVQLRDSPPRARVTPPCTAHGIAHG